VNIIHNEREAKSTTSANFLTEGTTKQNRKSNQLSSSFEASHTHFGSAIACVVDEKQNNIIYPKN